VPTPAITVVVATHNRASLLPRLLDGLAAQAGVDFEAVIVDDASTDDTWEVLGRLAESAPFPLRPIRLEVNSGAATARNTGWRAASAPLVAFTDDDCVPAPGWLAALVADLRDHDLVQGRTLPNPDQSDRDGPFSRSIDVTGEYGYYETCNMGYRLGALEAAGGFDETFRYPYGEDCDLAWRVKDAGGRSTFDHDALVFHEVWPSDYRSHLRDKVRREGLVLALKKHPRLRSQRGVFQNGSHPSAVLAAGAGLFMLAERGPAGLGVAAVGGATYAWFCRRYHPGPARKVGWFGILPLHFVADICEVAVLARASLKYRALVL
jgi:glycosyltransferase involved in cell wall biosynthesis